MASKKSIVVHPSFLSFFSPAGGLENLVCKKTPSSQIGLFPLVSWFSGTKEKNKEKKNENRYTIEKKKKKMYYK